MENKKEKEVARFSVLNNRAKGLIRFSEYMPGMPDMIDDKFCYTVVSLRNGVYIITENNLIKRIGKSLEEREW